MVWGGDSYPYFSQRSTEKLSNFHRLLTTDLCCENYYRHIIYKENEEKKKKKMRGPNNPSVFFKLGLLQCTGEKVSSCVLGISNSARYCQALSQSGCNRNIFPSSDPLLHLLNNTFFF